MMRFGRRIRAAALLMSVIAMIVWAAFACGCGTRQTMSATPLPNANPGGPATPASGAQPAGPGVGATGPTSSQDVARYRYMQQGGAAR